MASEQSSFSGQVVKGDIKNNYPQNVGFLKNHDWSGHVAGQYAPVIKSGESYHFEHAGGEGVLDGSTKGAVIYCGLLTEPQVNPTETAFLVSWWKALEFAKVHVEVGTKGKFENINWDEIESKLNKSKEESSDFDTELTRTGIVAKIGRDGKLDVIFGARIPK